MQYTVTCYEYNEFKKWMSVSLVHLKRWIIEMKRSDYMVENDDFIHVIVFVFHFISFTSEESVSDLRFYLYQIQMYKMQ